MKLRMPRSPMISRLLRPLLALGLASGLVGALLLAGEPARGALGTEPGAVKLSATTGSTSSTPTWSTTQGCPTGYQGSAVLEEVHSDGTTVSAISQVVDSSAQALTGAFSGTLQASIARIKSLGGIANGGAQELVVQCTSEVGDTGNVQDDMDLWITYSSDGTAYSTSSSQPATSATSSSSGSPTTCASATPTATATPNCSATPASGGSSATGSATGSTTSSPGPSATSTGPAPTSSPAQNNLPVTG